MSFTITYLADDRALVQEDTHQIILDAEEYLAMKLHQEKTGLIAQYDQSVADFFKPLTDMADKIKGVEEQENRIDPDFHVVLAEGTEGEEPIRREVYRLEKSTVILRLIEEGRTERLIWIGDDLEILAATAV